MVEDHSKANEQLKAALTQKGVTVPTVDPNAQKTYDKLSKLSGPEFDRAYMREMVADHRKDLKEFQNEAKNAKDPSLKLFAQETVPVIQQHLQMAERLAK
jgi:putative membrane protein